MAVFGPEFAGLSNDFEKVQAVMQPYGAFAQKEAVEDSAWATWSTIRPASIWLALSANCYYNTPLDLRPKIYAATWLTCFGRRIFKTLFCQQYVIKKNSG